MLGFNCKNFWPCIRLSWFLRLLKHGKSSFIVANHKANIVAHAVDDQSSNSFLCGKSWAIWVAQHSLATWPKCSLEPSSHSAYTLFLHCFTTLIWRNSWKGPCWHRTGQITDWCESTDIYYGIYVCEKATQVFHSFLLYLLVFHNVKYDIISLKLDSASHFNLEAVSSGRCDQKAFHIRVHCWGICGQSNASMSMWRLHNHR